MNDRRVGRIDAGCAAAHPVGVCNLYRLDRSGAEVAKWFAAREGAPANAPSEVYPGYPGLVIAGGEVRSMVWGFPLAQKGKSGQPLKPRPVNNTRTDKLDSPFWRPSFTARRCLIPVMAFAEAEGAKGTKTRSWISLPDQPIFAAAGIWRQSVEWGDVFSMVMTDASEAMGALHDRMPVLLDTADQARWTGGEPDEARDLCRPWPGALTIDRTDQPWNKPRG